MAHHRIVIEIDVEPGQKPVIAMTAETLGGDDIIFHLTNLVQTMHVELVTKAVLKKLAEIGQRQRILMPGPEDLRPFGGSRG